MYNQPNRLFARVHNLGTTPAVNVIVDFCYASNASSWFSLPSGTNNPTAVPVSGSSGFFRTEIPAAPPSN